MTFSSFLRSLIQSRFSRILDNSKISSSRSSSENPQVALSSILENSSLISGMSILPFSVRYTLSERLSGAHRVISSFSPYRKAVKSSLQAQFYRRRQYPSASLRHAPQDIQAPSAVPKSAPRFQSRKNPLAKSGVVCHKQVMK